MHDATIKIEEHSLSRTVNEVLYRTVHTRRITAVIHIRLTRSSEEEAVLPNYWGFLLSAIELEKSLWKIKTHSWIEIIAFLIQNCGVQR